MVPEIETVEVVLSLNVLVGEGDDDAMTLLGAVLGRKAEVLIDGFGFDGKLLRVAKPGRI